MLSCSNNLSYVISYNFCDSKEVILCQKKKKKKKYWHQPKHYPLSYYSTLSQYIWNKLKQKREEQVRVWHFSPGERWNSPSFCYLAGLSAPSLQNEEVINLWKEPKTYNISNQHHLTGKFSGCPIGYTDVIHSSEFCYKLEIEKTDEPKRIIKHCGNEEAYMLEIKNEAENQRIAKFFEETIVKTKSTRFHYGLVLGLHYKCKAESSWSSFYYDLNLYCLSMLFRW